MATPLNLSDSKSDKLFSICLPMTLCLTLFFIPNTSTPNGLSFLSKST